MNCSLSSPSAKALHSFFPSKTKPTSKKLSSSIITSKHTQKFSLPQSLHPSLRHHINSLWPNKFHLALELGALLSLVDQPAALAVTGVNNPEDPTWVLVQLGVLAFWYFLIMPPIILNWLRLRWYERKLLEMYLQFMCVFMFFPGLLLWAPFVNFRKLPRDPNMKYPWSTPQESALTKPKLR